MVPTPAAPPDKSDGRVIACCTIRPARTLTSTFLVSYAASRPHCSVSGDRKLKQSTPRLAPRRPQPPTMGFDNRAADREAHAHAVGLRRVEGFKETRQALRAQPMAGIPHRDAHALRLGTRGADV